MAWQPVFDAQICANLKGSAARRFDRKRMTKRKEFRHQSRRAAICGQAPHFGKDALVFWGATIRHDLSQGADNSTRGNSTCINENLADGICTQLRQLHVDGQITGAV